ncbi:MAG: phosphatidylserine decarboxylase family protein [Ignavibacteria bacterium]|nr:phosphatidylserine decarboxylase family protein [Ignavibacteria bacterium]
MITKYGYFTVGTVAVIFFILISASFFLNNPFIKYTLIVFSILLLAFTLNFFRDPERNIPKGDNIILSPADGTVLVIKDVQPDVFINEPCKQISIFMSPLNVHVNRIPISGKVDFLKYYEGEYLIASHEKADKRNERSLIGITSDKGKVLFTQVAGFVARRIIYELKTGQNVFAGKRFGMIKFGSRVDVIVPEKWVEKVKEGDKVTAGETILFELP